MGDEHRMRRERIRECKQSRDSMACVCRGAAVNEKLNRLWSAAGGGIVSRPRARGGCGRSGGRDGKEWRRLEVTEGATVLLGGGGGAGGEVWASDAGGGSQ